MPQDGDMQSSRTDFLADTDSRAEWTAPVLRKLKASEAETGIDFGPEILILVS